MISNGFGQENEKEKVYIQFSGIVVQADNITPIPYTSISIKNTYRGTIADYYGYFSIVASKNDTIEFSSVGYKKAKYIIPDTISSKRYSLIQVMTADTILLSQTVIYPWPSKDEFKEAFLYFDVPDDDYERAKKNLESAKIKEIAYTMPNTGSMNFRQDMSVYQQKLYYNGQQQPMSIFDAFAWAKFIKAWKNGDFKRKKNE